MVNKLYTVQKQQLSSINSKHCSPPPVRSSSIVSNAPNPTNFSPVEESNNFVDRKQRKILETIKEDRKIGKNSNPTYAMNLTLGNKFFGNQNSGTKSDKDDKDPKQQARAMLKDHLDINDIGRFQYILQMDKEMNSQSDKLHRIPQRVPMPPSRTVSSSSSINSTNNHFWKARSVSPITASEANNRQQICEQFYQRFNDTWKYTKWLLLAILCALLLGTSIYFIVSDSNRPINIPLIANISIFEEITENSINEHVIHDENTTTEDSRIDGEWDIKLSPDIGAVTIAKTKQNTTIQTTKMTTNPTTVYRTRPQYEQHSTQSPATTVSLSRNTKILQIYTHPGIQFEEDLKTTTEQMNKPKNEKIEPTKDSFDTIGFTSGHQNNFGIPIEEDERILKMLNEELMKHEAEETTRIYKSTTDASTYRTHVSPTLPIISHGIHSTTERLTTSSNNYTDIGNCDSTSLSICRGILQYDLTINESRKTLTPLEHEHFKYLFDSKCSTRASEFVCSALEPECRPSQMGILKPCKRICKSILEPCASIIASSEVLTITFDCDSYPDSSDRNVCEDPTRRGRCHDNEFQCLDSTCIPQQWKCDNIKDCSLGEDEDNCLLCEHEEFRCQSNDKCIPHKWRCDQYNDCPDGSDELDCYDYEDDTGNTEKEQLSNAREYPFASVQEPNSPKNKPYLTITADDEHSDSIDETYDDRFLPTAPDNDSGVNYSEDKGDNEDVQKGEASTRVLIGVPKSIANFQDSKEIMMTSDSENDFKYSKMNQTIQSTTVRIDELTPGPSQCPEGQLRCVSGECISVEQICDKVVDCPDGADEAMCVYKDTS